MKKFVIDHNPRVLEESPPIKLNPEQGLLHGLVVVINGKPNNGSFRIISIDIPNSINVEMENVWLNERILNLSIPLEKNKLRDRIKGIEPNKV